MNLRKFQKTEKSTSESCKIVLKSNEVMKEFASIEYFKIELEKGEN